jgi:hypothetical protein
MQRQGERRLQDKNRRHYLAVNCWLKAGTCIESPDVASPGLLNRFPAARTRYRSLKIRPSLAINLKVQRKF